MKKQSEELVEFYTNSSEELTVSNHEIRERLLFILDNKLSKELETLAVAGITCHSICVKTLIFCLKLPKTAALRELIKSLSNCADVSEINSDLIISGSNGQTATNKMAARVSLDCAIIANNFDDPEIQECSKICRSYSKRCKNHVVG